MTRKAGTTKTRKAKGRRLQQYVAKRLIEVARANPDDVKVAIMGETGPDVTYLSYCVECTNSEKINIWKKVEQCERNTEIYQQGKPFRALPITVIKKNNSRAYAVVDFEVLLATLVMAAEGQALSQALIREQLDEMTVHGKGGSA